MLGTASALRKTKDFIFWTKRSCEISNSTKNDYRLHLLDQEKV